MTMDGTRTETPLDLMRDGLHLRGVIERPAGAGRCPAVILLHGFTGTMAHSPGTLFQQIADGLVDRGVAVVRFDFNGHGGSDGDFTRMDVLNEVEDAIAVLEHVRSLDWVTGIRLGGHSQGGVVAGLVAALYHEVVERVALMAPAATLVDDALAGVCMGAVYDPDHVPDSVTLPDGHRVGGHYFRIAQLLPVYDLTARYQGDMLIVQGQADTVVSPVVAQRYGREANRKVCRYPHLDHGLLGDEAEHRAAVATVVDYLS